MRTKVARENWCPFVRMAVIASDGPKLAGYNRMFFNDGEKPRGKCLTFGCMAWREDWTLNNLQYEKYGGKIPEEEIYGFCDLLRRSRDNEE